MDTLFYIGLGYGTIFFDRLLVICRMHIPRILSVFKQTFDRSSMNL